MSGDAVTLALREMMWIGLCYNDHNFKPSHIQDKCKNACEHLGINNVDEANERLDQIVAALDSQEKK